MESKESFEEEEERKAGNMRDITLRETASEWNS
jgi:hypothetical protein